VGTGSGCSLLQQFSCFLPLDMSLWLTFNIATKQQAYSSVYREALPYDGYYSASFSVLFGSVLSGITVSDDYFSSVPIVHA
jgi:hypothetical protein